MAASITSSHQWVGMRSEYARVPPQEIGTRTGPGQIGVAFSAHTGVEFAVDGKRGRATYPAGSVVVSGRSEICWSRVAEPTEALEIYLDQDLLSRVTDGALDAPPEVRPVIGGEDLVVVGAATMVRRVHEGLLELDDVEASSLVHRVAYRLITQYAGLPVTSAGGTSRLRNGALKTVHRLVEENLGQSLSLESLAAAAHFSPFHFARAFTETVGMPPHYYVTLRRMDHAARLLTHSTMPVSQIAATVGYTNLSHFRRVFRAHTGALPSQLRQPDRR